MKKVVIFAAPSGSGKSTIINSLLTQFPSLEFSISATSRSPRGEEVDGREYYFLSIDDFKSKVADGQFIEWEEVYSGSCYGTLKQELNRIWEKGNIVVFDIDVKGALNIKKIFGDDALSIFIMPPSIEELRSRLESRATDSQEAIERRLAKAQEEISFSKHFDKVVVNDLLSEAISESQTIIADYIKQ